jgi:hypothetical protein
MNRSGYQGKEKETENFQFCRFGLAQNFLGEKLGA